MEENLNNEVRPEGVKTQYKEVSQDIPQQDKTVLPGTQNPIPKNVNMETHAHELHKAPGHGWKHYLFEFFMLFLAVFCGFLAEYLLEHKIDHEKGREYVLSFYEDLKTDTSNFQTLINRYQKKMMVLNTRNDCFDSITHNFQSTNCLEALFDNASRFPDLVYTDRTLQQLKNSGGLRLLSADDADSILVYDNLLRIYTRAETTSFQETQTSIRNTLYSLISYQKRKSTGVDILVKDHEDLLNRFFNQLEKYSGYCKNNIDDIVVLKSKATTLIQYFRNKYSLR